MRNPKNYYKFMEHVALGKLHNKVSCTDNGVLECMSYITGGEIETRSKCKTPFDENEEVTIMQRLINEEALDICNIRDGRVLYIATFLLDNYKTQKELKLAIYRAVVEFLLSTEKENKDIDEFIESENLEEIEETTTHATIETLPPPIYNETDINTVCMKCLADRQGNRCGGTEFCEQTWKRYKAIIKPEWHHVSLNTFANLDFDMLDTKRQKYMMIYKLARNTIKSMYKCKSITQYRSLTNRLITYVHSAYRHDRCSIALVQYVRAKIADVNVNCNVQSSIETEEFGYHESRRYN